MSKRVLVAPLDWGLGHATRCIPVVEALLERNCEVTIASSGSALALLKKEFPALKFFRLPPYRIKYPESGSFVFSIVKQIPRIRRVIAKEKKRTQKIVSENKIDLIISDNRYGCWLEKTPSVLICHQLNIQLHSGWRLLKPATDFFHHRALRKFSHCWIPDAPEINLTGALSKGSHPEINYVGILSRFKKTSSEPKYDLAFILSGPEPQRGMLEEIVLKQTRGLDQKVIIVRGVVEGEGNWRQDGNVTFVNFLQSAKLEEIMNQSKLIVARSGYSTIMDLSRLGKKAILIPTPGQTEQEYLGYKLMQDKIALCVDQNNFEIATALQDSQDFSGFSNIEHSGDLLDKALSEILR